jgi:phage anti-repressor protein
MNKKTETKKSTNLKSGKFTTKELKLYNLNDKEIETILKYQEQLPILQEDNETWINTRDLHNQLKVSRDYSDWIKQQIRDLDYEENLDYKQFTLSKGKTSEQGGRPKTNYYTSIENAKEIAMIAGAKGGKTGKELKELSKIARKYFIYIEKAFKQRYEWNEDRDNTLIKCKVLRKSIIRNKGELDKTRPSYCNNNFIAEFCLLNEVIIGMSAKQYRAIKGLNKSAPIRNTFSERELELVHLLEQYDADLITVQNEYDWNKRKEYLSKKLKMELGISA